MTRNVEDVFVTEGVPEYTFVRPPNFNDILLDVRRAGKPVIIEGQSGTGKTTTIRKVLEEVDQNANTIPYLTPRKPADLDRIQEILSTREPRTFVIDDFHRLPEALQTEFANLAKIAAELPAGSEGTLPKLILIGINQTGSDLIQLVPDIAKRTGVHRIQPGSPADVTTLIERGARELNVEFDGPDRIFAEVQGITG